MPGRPPKNASTVSSKLNSQNGSRRLRGVSTCDLSPKQRPYSLCGSIRKIRRSGCSSRIFCRMIATPFDLPTPVVPSTAKCLLTRLLDVDLRRNRVVLLQHADRIELGVAAIDDAQLAIGHQHRRLADDRIFGDAALEVRGARPGLGFDLADQIQPRDAAARVVLVAHRTFGDLGDHADDDRTAAQDPEEFADGGLRSIGRDVGRAETDGDLRAADGVNASDHVAIGWRRRRCRRRRCGGLCECRCRRCGRGNAVAAGAGVSGWRKEGAAGCRLKVESIAIPRLKMSGRAAERQTDLTAATLEILLSDPVALSVKYNLNVH